MDNDDFSSISSELGIRNISKSKKVLKFSGKITRRISLPEQNQYLSRDQKKAIQVSRIIEKQDLEDQRKLKKVKSEEPNHIERSSSEDAVQKCQEFSRIMPSHIPQFQAKITPVKQQSSKEQKLTLNPQLTIQRKYELSGILSSQKLNNQKLKSKYDNSSHYNGHGQQYTSLYPINNDVNYETSILLYHFTQGAMSGVDKNNVKRYLDKNYLENVLREQRLQGNKMNKF